MSDIKKDNGQGSTGLIRESLDYWFVATPEQIHASKEKHNGRLVMETCMQRSDKANQMNRIYPHKILQREFDAYQTLVEEKRAYGHCDHDNSSVVEFQNACLVVDKQYWKKGSEGDMEWWGDIEILNTSKGKDIQAIVEAGKRVSVSSRGVGSVQYDQKRDADVVQEDFVLIAFDAVCSPSVHNANMILKEGYELHKNKYAYRRFIELKINMLNSIDLLSRGLYDNLQNNELGQ